MSSNDISVDILKNHDFLLFKSEKKDTVRTLVDDKIINSNKLIN